MTSAFSAPLRLRSYWEEKSNAEKWRKVKMRDGKNPGFVRFPISERISGEKYHRNNNSHCFRFLGTVTCLISLSRNSKASLNSFESLSKHWISATRSFTAFSF